MLFISAGPFKMTHDLLVLAGNQEIRTVLKKYSITPPDGPACNVGVLSVQKLARCIWPSLLGENYAVKTHAYPGRAFRFFQQLHLVKTTYIDRDPRDAALSAFEAGQRASASQLQSYFSNLLTIEDAILFLSKEIRTWQAWTSCPGIFITRYEDLLAAPETVMADLFRFWSLPVCSDEISRVVQTYNAKNIIDPKISNKIHLNVARTGRFREKMTPAQQALCSDLFGPYLEKMGYPLS